MPTHAQIRPIKEINSISTICDAYRKLYPRVEAAPDVLTISEHYWRPQSHEQWPQPQLSALLNRVESLLLEPGSSEKLKSCEEIVNALDHYASHKNMEGRIALMEKNLR